MSKPILVLDFDGVLHKPPAMVTIDDRAIQFKGSWPEPEKLLEFKPYRLPDWIKP